MTKSIGSKVSHNEIDCSSKESQMYIDDRKSDSNESAVNELPDGMDRSVVSLYRDFINYCVLSPV